MGEGQSGGSKPFDPLESFRGLRDIYLDAMAKTMVETVNTEGYAKASGAMLDSTLTMSAPMRESMEKSMLQVLQQLSLPSRQDIVILAERFTNMEMRLDDLDAKLDRVLKGVEGLSRPTAVPAEPVAPVAPAVEVSPVEAAEAASAEPVELSGGASPIEQVEQVGQVEQAAQVVDEPAAPAKSPAKPRKANSARKGAK